MFKLMKYILYKFIPYEIMRNHARGLMMLTSVNEFEVQTFIETSNAILFYFFFPLYDDERIYTLFPLDQGFSTGAVPPPWGR